jgi:hypothetical protein
MFEERRDLPWTFTWGSTALLSALMVLSGGADLLGVVALL